MFDCLASKDVAVPDSIKDRTEFHPICVGERDEVLEGRKFLTWASLNRLAGHGAHVSYLKMHADGEPQLRGGECLHLHI